MSIFRRFEINYLAIFAGPILFALSIFLLQDSFNFEAAVAIGSIFWIGLWWVFRPVHIAVTALVPIAINAIFNIVPMDTVISQYFSEIIILLFGADLICLTWTTTGLDKRVAIKALCLIGVSMRQQIAMWLIASAVLSAFLPNVVVCTILIPVAISMLKFIGVKDIGTSELAVPILLAITWGAGIGGFASPLGGAANLVAINYIEQYTGQEFMYFDWVVRFAPFLIVIIIMNLFYLFSIKLSVDKIEGSTIYFHSMYKEMGKMKRGEKISLILFVMATALAFIRPLYADVFPGMKPAYVFLVFGLFTFLFKDEKGTVLLTWQKVEEEMMWGMLFLFAGGLALGKLVTGTGAAVRFAEIMAERNLSGGLVLIFLFVIFSSGLSEISSNTAAAAIAIPVIMSITLGLELNFIPYLFIAIVAFNSAYILPVSIRAIPVGFGLDPGQLFKHGSRLALLSVFTISIVGYIFMKIWPLFSTL